MTHTIEIEIGDQPKPRHAMLNQPIRARLTKRSATGNEMDRFEYGSLAGTVGTKDGAAICCKIELGSTDTAKLLDPEPFQDHRNWPPAPGVLQPHGHDDIP